MRGHDDSQFLVCKYAGLEYQERGSPENDIILMHDSYDSTVKAALRIVDLLQAEGYEFVTADELILE